MNNNDKYIPLPSKSEEEIAELTHNEVCQQINKEQNGPSGPNVDKQYEWPTDKDDDIYHAEEVH